MGIEVRLENHLKIFHLGFELDYVLDFNNFFLKVEADVFGTEGALLDALEVLHVVHF